MRGGADQADCALLDIGKQDILLCLVESVDFVDEHDGAHPVGAFAFSCRIEGAADVGD